MNNRGPETVNKGGETGSERHPLEQGEAGGVPPFNPEHAMSLREAAKEQTIDEPAKSEMPEIENDEPMALAESKENSEADSNKAEREKQPTPKEAAEEYMHLLDELSKDFPNPFYRGEEGGYNHASRSVANQLGQEYSLDDPHYRWQGYRGTEAGEDDRTLLRMSAAGQLSSLQCAIARKKKTLGVKLSA